MIRYNGAVMDGEVLFPCIAPAGSTRRRPGRTAWKRRYIHGHRWCDTAAIGELVGRTAGRYPLQLADLIDEANRFADTRPGTPAPRPIC